MYVNAPKKNTILLSNKCQGAIINFLETVHPSLYSFSPIAFHCLIVVNLSFNQELRSSLNLQKNIQLGTVNIVCKVSK